MSFNVRDLCLLEDNSLVEASRNFIPISRLCWKTNLRQAAVLLYYHTLFRELLLRIVQHAQKETKFFRTYNSYVQCYVLIGCVSKNSREIPNRTSGEKARFSDTVEKLN